VKLHQVSTYVVIGKVTIVNDGRVEDFTVVHNGLVRLLADHGSRTAVLGVDCGDYMVDQLWLIEAVLLLLTPLV
jgi:hypothetical protein